MLFDSVKVAHALRDNLVGEKVLYGFHVLFL